MVAGSQEQVHADLGLLHALRPLLHPDRDAIRGARSAPHRTAPHRAAPRRLTPDDDLGRPHLARRAREQVALLETKFDWLFVINWLVNLVFICDMVFNLI